MHLKHIKSAFRVQSDLSKEDLLKMASEYYDFPAAFQKIKAGTLVFIHNHQNLDLVLQGGDLINRASAVAMVSKSLLIVELGMRTSAGAPKKGMHVWLGLPRLKGVANCYIHDVKGGKAYIGSMTNRLEK